MTIYRKSFTCALFRFKSATHCITFRIDAGITCARIVVGFIAGSIMPRPGFTPRTTISGWWPYFHLNKLSFVVFFWRRWFTIFAKKISLERAHTVSHLHGDAVIYRICQCCAATTEHQCAAIHFGFSPVKYVTVDFTKMKFNAATITLTIAVSSNCSRHGTVGSAGF